MQDLNEMLQQEEYERVVNNKDTSDSLEDRSHLFYQIRYLLERNSHFDDP